VYLITTEKEDKVVETSSTVTIQVRATEKEDKVVETSSTVTIQVCDN